MIVYMYTYENGEPFYVGTSNSVAGARRAKSDRNTPLRDRVREMYANLQAPKLEILEEYNGDRSLGHFLREKWLCRLAEQWPGAVFINRMGAHSVPTETNGLPTHQGVYNGEDE